MITRASTRVGLLVGALVTYLPGSALAHESPGPSQGGADAEVAQLQEVLVTARRREENLQSVPIAVTAVSQETLQENNIKTVADLQYLVPSMSVNPTLTRDDLSVSIRGQGLNSITGLPGVIAYLNEVPIPSDINGALAVGPGMLFDLENVQVLKGPQGTLFGRNSVGGALLLQTARPKKDFEGTVEVTYGNYNDREIDGAVNIPLVSETLLARIAFSAQVRDGFTHLLGEPGHPDGIDADNRDFWAVRGTMTFHPVDEFQNDTILSFSEHNSHGSPFILTNVNQSPTGCGGQPCLIPALFPSFSSLFAEQQALGARSAIPVDNHLTASGKLFSLNNLSRLTLGENLTLRNIFGFADSHSVYQLDFDGTSLPLIEQPFTPSDGQVQQFSDELQLLGKSFGERLDWIVGAFYLYSGLPSGDGWVLQTGRQFGLPTDTELRRRDKTKALFAQGSYDLGSLLRGLELTVGARYTWDDRFASSRGGTGSVCTPPTVQCTDISYADARDRALTWTGGLDYQITRDTLLYVTSRRGYRAGGSNGPPTNRSYGPEYVDDVELGIKSDWNLAGVPVRTNADVYHQDYRDIQVQSLLLESGVINNITANAAAARIWGAEFEAMVNVTQNLQLAANFDYLDFAYTHFDAGVDPTALLATRSASRPPRKYGLSGRYRLPLNPQVGNVSLQANWNWQARTALSSIDAFGEPGTVIPAYALLNLSANWDEVVGAPLDLSLFASNVTNQLYRVGGLSFYDNLGFIVQKLGEPRMYGVRLRYRF